MSRCLLAARSAKTYREPLSRVGIVQRAVKTPATMHSEIANGDRPELTSLVGASAAPSHTPAANPQATPRPCLDAKAGPGLEPWFALGVAAALALTDLLIGGFSQVAPKHVRRIFSWQNAEPVCDAWNQ